MIVPSSLYSRSAKASWATLTPKDAAVSGSAREHHEHGAGVEQRDSLGDCLHQGVIVAGHAVHRAVRLEVGQCLALRTGDGGQGAVLIEAVVGEIGRRDGHRAPAETKDVGEARVGADGDTSLGGVAYRLAHVCWVARMKAASDIVRRYILHEG